MNSSDVGAEGTGRLDTAVERATALTKKTMEFFPVRVWRHFLRNNGFLLAAGVSYQALFAIFATIYVAFAIVGLWLGASPEAIDALITLINGYVPGLISETSGLASPDDVQRIAAGTTNVLGITGLIAAGTLIWTAISWVTYSRRAVRDIFDLAPDTRSYVYLKARDFLAAIMFGAALIVGAALSTTSTLILDWLFSLIGWSTERGVLLSTVRIGTVVVSFALNSASLAALFRFLAGADLQWRRIWPGALLGGAATTVLQFGAGLLIGRTPTNPLLGTFAIFIGLLLWFRLAGIVMLISAAWIAVSAQDRDLTLHPMSEEERLAAEQQALLAAAHVWVRRARAQRASAPWYRVWAANRELRNALDHLNIVEAAAPENVDGPR